MEEEASDKSETNPAPSASSSSEVSSSPYKSLTTVLHALEPHLMLRQDLENLLIDDHAASASSTLPPPSAPPALEAAPTTEESPTAVGGVEEEVFEEEEEPVMAAIMPYTDSQLHALYHNVELEKNIEFVDHFLETQRHIDKFQLVDLLTNYHRYSITWC